MWRVRGDLEWRIYGRTLKYQYSHRRRYAGGVRGEEENRRRNEEAIRVRSVSYTHLTLPTICSV